MSMRRTQARPPERGPRPARQYHPVPLDQIDPALPTAVMIAEDYNFYVHDGIDYAAIRTAMGYHRLGFHWTDPDDLRAMAQATTHAWGRRDAIRGASTLTQQLAKNLYLSPSRNPLRKVKEAVTAWRLEHALGKQRILELYLNVVEMGDEVWGADAASRAYYGSPASELSRAQAASLAGLLPFPLRSNPDHRPRRMLARQALILRRMRGEHLEVPRDLGATDSVSDGADTTAVGDSAAVVPDSTH